MRQTARFPLGRCVMTRGASDAMTGCHVDPLTYLVRHASLDRGALDVEDHATNAQALNDGGRIVSSYYLPDETRIWIITEADRSLTTIMLPSEY